jgi:hypothetical protein
MKKCFYIFFFSCTAAFVITFVAHAQYTATGVPLIPYGISATPDSDNLTIELRWDGPVEKDVTIGTKRRPLGGTYGSPQTIDSEKKYFLDEAGFGLQPGTWEYIFHACRSNFGCSPYTDPIAVTLTAVVGGGGSPSSSSSPPPLPPPSTITTTTNSPPSTNPSYPPPPYGVYAIPHNDDFTIEVRWQGPRDKDTLISVHRRPAGGTFSVIEEMPNAPAENGYFIDKYLKKAGTWEYKLQSYVKGVGYSEGIVYVSATIGAGTGAFFPLPPPSTTTTTKNPPFSSLSPSPSTAATSGVSGNVNSGSSPLLPPPSLLLDTIAPSVTKFDYTRQSDNRIFGRLLFSESVALPDASAVFLRRVFDGSRMIGSVKGTNEKVEFISTDPLPEAVEFELVAAGVKDLAGNSMAAEYVSPKFLFEQSLQTLAAANEPFVVAADQTSPAPDEKGVPLDAAVKVVFNHPLDIASAAGPFFILSAEADSAASISGTFSFSESSFTFIPSSALSPGTRYRFTVQPLLKDKGGRTLSSIYSVSFVTAAIAPKTAGVIEGVVRDADDNPVSGASLYAVREDEGAVYSVASGSDGLFSLTVPAAAYTMRVYPPPGAVDALLPQFVKIQIGGGERRPVSFRFAVLRKTIAGKVSFSDGTPVTDAEVAAYSEATGQWVATSTDGAGAYNLSVGVGTWRIKVQPKNRDTARWSLNEELPDVVFTDDVSDKDRIVTIVVPLAGSTLSVRTIDGANGSPLHAGVFVAVSPGEGIVSDTVPPEFKKSDESGTASFSLKPGTYIIRSYLPSERGYLNPPEQKVSLQAGVKMDITMVFRGPDAVSFVPLRGSLRLENGVVSEANLWAWSESGRAIEKEVKKDGHFELFLTSNDRWHIGAAVEIRGVLYKSSEILLPVSQSPLSIDLILIKRDQFVPAASVTQSALRHLFLETKSGIKVYVPASAAAPSGSVSVKVEPTAKMASQPGAKVIGKVYDVSANHAGGGRITSFSDYIEIVLPYDEKEVQAQGVSEDRIVPSFFDEAVGAWVRAEQYILDAEKNVAVIRMKHLTRFAIVAAADVVAPDDPSGITAIASPAGTIRILWTNPAEDFSHAKVYRSEKKGVIGKILAPEVQGGEFSDVKDLQRGVTYYYTVRAVDPAGNESGNIRQVAVRLDSKILPPPLPKYSETGFLRSFGRGTRGDDVRLLQEILVREGVYPEALMTGLYGSLTAKAVARFQEKYAREILTPAGLTRGTGYVGPSTRKKLNSVLSAR